MLMSNGHHTNNGEFKNSTNGHHHNNGHHLHQQMMSPQQRNSMAMLPPGPRATYSLPRAPTGQRHVTTSMSPNAGIVGSGYYTQDRRNMQPRYAAGNGKAGPSMHQPQPDFYFMPSQRKYSGEVVRVYVDYANQKNK